MPGANKYSVATTNRFMLDSAGDSSGSEDEGNIQNQDPFAMLKQAEVDAVKNAKQAQKDKAKAEKDAKLAAKKAATAAITGNAEKADKVDNRRNDRPRREPKGNQQQRRGPRQEERAPRDGEQAVAENKDGQVENSRPPRTNDRRRGNDRKSGDPRTGYKGQAEKRGGRGKGNWGDKTENPEENAPTEQVTDENAEAKEEKKVDGEEAEEEQVPEEPVEVQLTLEEYMASLSTTANTTTKARKANDGEELKGQQYHAKKVHHEKARKFGGHEREDKKFVIDSKDLGFKSGSGRGGFFYDGDRNDDRRGGRGGRGGGRGGARNQGNRGEGNRRQESAPKAFNMKSLNDEAFPTLGGK